MLYINFSYTLLSLLFQKGLAPLIKHEKFLQKVVLKLKLISSAPKVMGLQSSKFQEEKYYMN